MSDPVSKGMSNGEPGIGLRLRQQREALGWRIEDVAEHIRIRPAILIALEEENYPRLPEPVYVTGFLKSYASYLGVDISQQIDRFLSAQGKSVSALPASENKIARLSFVQTREPRSVPVGGLIFAGILGVAAAYGGWYYFERHEAPLHHIPLLDQAKTATAKQDAAPEGQPPATEMGQTALDNQSGSAQFPPNTAPSDMASANTTSGNQWNGQADNMVTVDPNSPFVAHREVGTGSSGVVIAPDAALPDAKKGIDDKRGNEQTIATQSSSSQSSSSQPSSSQSGEAGIAEGDIVLHADKKSWVQIKDAQGHPVFEAILTPGTQWKGAKDGAPYRITTGNAGGVTLQAGSVNSAPLGKEGQVLRGLVVDAPTIISGKWGKRDVAGSAGMSDLSPSSSSQ